MARAIAFALIAAATLAAGFGVSQAEPDPQCSWDTAAQVSVRGLDGSETSLRGHCVRLRAELDGWALRSARPHYGLAATEIDFVGAYSRDQTLMDRFHAHPRRVEVLGVAGHCSDMCAGVEQGQTRHDADGNDYVTICVPVGFCHYYDDPFVMIQAVR